MELPVNYDEISPSERRKVRLEYMKLQDKLCYYCKTKLFGDPSKEVQDKYINTKLFPDGFFNYPVHLHHNHDTGMTIGVVHDRCNAVLFQYHGE